MGEAVEGQLTSRQFHPEFFSIIMSSISNLWNEQSSKKKYSSSSKKKKTKPAYKSVLISERPTSTLSRHLLEAAVALEELDEQKANNTDDALQAMVVRSLDLLSSRSSRFLLRKSQISPGMTIEKDYKGPRLPVAGTNSPWSVKDVEVVIDWYKSKGKLHYRYYHLIMAQMLDNLQKERMFWMCPILVLTLTAIVVTDITTPHNGRLNIVGDIHGQLADLLTILRVQGVPSATNYYFFNGDFVDRGPFGPEVLLIMYLLKLVFPTYVFLNRGNHENKLMNKRYSFSEQVLNLYDDEMLTKIQQTFQWLPLAAVVDKESFIVHGGLTERDITVDSIRETQVDFTS